MDFDYEYIFKELNYEGIDYVVVGGLAVNFHGIPRMTYDIDLMIRLDKENVVKTVDKLQSLGYLPRAPVSARDLADAQVRETWIREMNMKAFSFYSPDQPIGEIDLMIDLPLSYEAIKGRALIFQIGNTSVPVISLKDLIQIKQTSSRKQDLSDVEHLRRLLDR